MFMETIQRIRHGFAPIDKDLIYWISFTPNHGVTETLTCARMGRKNIKLRGSVSLWFKVLFIRLRLWTDLSPAADWPHERL